MNIRGRRDSENSDHRQSSRKKEILHKKNKTPKPHPQTNNTKPKRTKKTSPQKEKKNQEKKQNQKPKNRKNTKKKNKTQKAAFRQRKKLARGS